MPVSRFEFSSARRARLARVALPLATALALSLAGCGEPRHELRPPTQVSAVITDPTPPPLPPVPPVPDDGRAFDTDWLYCIYPRTLGLRETFSDPASGGYVISLGPVQQPIPPPSPSTPPPPAPANPALPIPPSAPPPAEPPPARPTSTTVRIILLPGYPGDAFDRNINGASALGASMGTLYSQLFGNRVFSDFSAQPVAPPPGMAQAWRIEAVDPVGRCYGFIARSRSLAAWSFALCEPGATAQADRDRLFSHLRLRLGQTQRFDDLYTDYRLDAPVPNTWTVPGPSPLSRRWDAPDHLGFLIITRGEPRGASVFRTCTADDARDALRDFPPVKTKLAANPLELRAWDQFQPALWAATGRAQTTLDTLPHATTVGVHVFYDPVARKKFCVYYGYQSDLRKRELAAMLNGLARTALMPAPAP